MRVFESIIGAMMVASEHTTERAGLCRPRRGGSALTEKQRRFCDEYLIDCNATQAAIRAGYSPKTAKSVGQRLLTYADLKAYIDTQLAQLHTAKIADAEEVLTYLTAVMRGESAAAELVTELVGNGVSEARVVEKAPSEKERLRAAELIGKRHGIFTDRLNVEGAVPVVIRDDLTPD